MRFSLFAVAFGPFVASLFTLASANPAPAAAGAKTVKIPIDDFMGPKAELIRTTTEGPTVGSRLTEVPAVLYPEGFFDRVDCAFRQNKCDRHCKSHTRVVYPEGYKVYYWKGYVHKTSDTFCGPGSISSTTSFSYAWSVGFQLGPDLKVPAIKAIDKFGFRVQGSYTWGEARSIGYQSTCDSDYPCYTTFQPSVAKVVGNIVLQRVADNGGRVCEESQKTLATVTLPLTVGETNDAAGIRGHCFIIGDVGKRFCPGSSFRKTPTDHICPAGMK